MFGSLKSGAQWQCQAYGFLLCPIRSEYNAVSNISLTDPNQFPSLARHPSSCHHPAKVAPTHRSMRPCAHITVISVYFIFFGAHFNRTHQVLTMAATDNREHPKSTSLNSSIPIMGMDEFMPRLTRTEHSPSSISQNTYSKIRSFSERECGACWLQNPASQSID
ncbi:hypothetical protein BDN67DRAFT_544801 [Paxillus ammoniavirescens]|nr:hypothetical protein BDN67DRAFT_544801 [Paxillus ammoniavirescens]